MKFDEFKKFRKTHKLTQQRLGLLLGRQARIIRGYEKGEYPIPLNVEIFIESFSSLSASGQAKILKKISS